MSMSARGPIRGASADKRPRTPDEVPNPRLERAIRPGKRKNKQKRSSMVGITKASGGERWPSGGQRQQVDIQSTGKLP